jgi:nitroreductase
MQKLAETRYPIHELLRERWSPRAFADRMIEPEKLQSLLEAARWAPSLSSRASGASPRPSCIERLDEIVCRGNSGAVGALILPVPHWDILQGGM